MTDDRTETIHDRAAIRDSDEPSERGDFPCCTPERVPLDLDALHETICDKFTGMDEVRQAADLLVAEVRRLAAVDDDLSRQIHETGGLLERAQAAEAAEAEVVTLRAQASHPADDPECTSSPCEFHEVAAERDVALAKVAAVEALHCEAAGKCAHCRDCYLDEALAWPCPTAAALSTGEGQ